MPRRIKVEPWALLALFAACAVGFWPGLVGDLPWVRDVPGFTLPSRALWRAAVLAGRLPEWNPYVQLGAPHLANPVHGALYAGHIPLLLAPLALGFSVTWILHAWLGGVGGFLLARDLGCRPLAALVSGGAWALGGYSVSMWWNGEKVLSQAWVPWAVMFLLRALREGVRPHALWAALCMTGIALAGDPFLWFFVLVLTLPLWWAQPRQQAAALPGGRLGTLVIRLGVSLSLAVLISAVLLLPAWLLRPETERAVGYVGELATRWSLHPVRLLEWVAPGALGDPLELARYPGRDFARNPEQQALPWAVSIYPGIVASCCAFAARKDRLSAALLGTVAFALFLALGEHTPLYGLLTTGLPPLAWMRYPEKYMLICSGALALLGALGLEQILAGQVKLRVPLLAFGVLAVLGLTLAPASLRATTGLGLVHSALALGGMLGCMWGSQRWPRLLPLSAVVLLGELLIANGRLLRWVDAEQMLDAAQPVRQRIASGPASAPTRVFRVRQDHLSSASLPDQFAQLYGFGTYPGHDAAKSRRLQRAMRGLPLGQQLLYLRASWAILPPGVEPALELALRATDGWGLYRVPEDMPRAWKTNLALFVPGDEARQRLRAGHALAGPILLPAGAGEPSDETPRGTACQLERPTPERAIINCPGSATAAWIAWAEGFSPGWSAWASDRPLQVEPANLAQLAAAVPAPATRVEFRYDTPGLLPGAMLSALGMLFGGLLLVSNQGGGRRGVPGVEREQ